MKAVFNIIVLCLSILVSGCTAIKVDSNYDAGFDFSNLNSYSWLEMPVDFPVDNLSSRNIKTAIDQQMKNKGFSLTTGAEDFIISLQGYKNTVRRAPQTQVSAQLSENEQFQDGMFTVTIIDAKSNRLIWEGHAKGLVAPYLSTEDRIKKVNETVAKLLADFPPAQ
jgi:hypothetical protein